MASVEDGVKALVHTKIWNDVREMRKRERGRME